MQNNPRNCLMLFELKIYLIIVQWQERQKSMQLWCLVVSLVDCCGAHGHSVFFFFLLQVYVIFSHLEKKTRSAKAIQRQGKIILTVMYQRKVRDCRLEMVIESTVFCCCCCCWCWCYWLFLTNVRIINRFQINFLYRWLNFEG